MSRKNDRSHAFNLVFQLGFYEQIDVEAVMSRYYDSLENSAGIDKAFVEKEFRGVIENFEVLDEHIGNAAVDWDFSRLSKVDIAIMRLAVYELIFENSIPTKVSVNEAVELAKDFSSDEAPAFINGILGKIVSVTDEMVKQ